MRLPQKHPLTLAAWVNLPSFATSNGIIYASDSSFAARMYVFTNGALVADFGPFVETTVTVGLNAWHHVCAVFTSTTLAAYIDGGGKVSATGQTPTTVFSSGDPTTTSAIGSAAEVSWFDCLGAVAFPAIWNFTLTDADVASLAAGASPLMVQPGNLVSYCRLTGGSSPEPDLLGGSFALTGTPTESVNPRIFRP
jgi:hypothetical protein